MAQERPLRRLDGLAYELRRIAHKHKSGAFQEERIVSLTDRGKAVRVSPRFHRWGLVGRLAVDYAARVFRAEMPPYREKVASALASALMTKSIQKSRSLHSRYLISPVMTLKSAQGM